MSNSKPNPTAPAPSQNDSLSQSPSNAIQKPAVSADQAHETQFEKNYPKNIFIPLIEYLTELGYKQSYQKCVGFRAQFQGKNVVSLSAIYFLINQDWFLRNINKQQALSHISNKILLSSKIKKKLFHLLIAHLIFTTDFVEVKDFKRRVSKEANITSKKQFPNDEVFSYPNTIIYLMHLFLKILLFHANKKGYNKLEEQFEKLSLEQPVTESKTKAQGSKEEYKFYVKEIVHIFAAKGIASQNYTDIIEEVRQTILQKEKNFRDKYRLVDGIPNWIHFIEHVVMKCFEYKKKDTKITNFLFNQWINECKNRMLSITDSKQTTESQESQKNSEHFKWIKEKLQFHDKWSALPLPLISSAHHQSKEKQADKTKPGIAKSFTPIILSSSLAPH